MTNLLNPTSMKTMKKNIALITVMVFAISFSAFSQNSKAKKTEIKQETSTLDDGKMHIKIEIEKDGKSTKIDTTVKEEDLASLNEYLQSQDLNIHVGSEEEFPGLAAGAFSFAWDGEQVAELEKQLKDKQINLQD